MCTCLIVSFHARGQVSVPVLTQFGVSFQNIPIGVFSQTFSTDEFGHIEVEETLQVLTVTAKPRIRIKQYLFSATEPHPIVVARSIERYENQPDQLIASFDPINDDARSTLTFGSLLVDQSFDYSTMRTVTIKGLNHQMTNLIATKLDVVKTDENFNSPTNGLNRQMLIDKEGRVRTLTRGDISYTRLLTDRDVQNWTHSLKVPFDALLKVPVLGSITSPQDIRTLHIKFHLDENTEHSWAPFLDSENTLIVRSDIRRAVQPNDVEKLPLLQESHYLNALNSITKKLQIPNSDQRALTAYLVTFVHEFLTYVDTNSKPTLLEIINLREGDCTEFAELFRALADHLGLTAKTTYGLVYDASSNTFQPHAWNEVALEGVWVGVDPTFNQTALDATHIPYPTESHASLMYDLRTTTFEITKAS